MLRRVPGMICMSLAVVLSIGSLAFAQQEPREPFQASDGIEWSPGEQLISFSFPTVPPGRLLVIEYMSASAEVPVGQRVQVRTVLKGGPEGEFFPSPPTHHFPLQFQGRFPTLNTPDIFSGAQQVRIYVSAGRRLMVTWFRSAGTGRGECRAAISGYLMDAP
jgi:hypothetical protein